MHIIDTQQFRAFAEAVARLEPSVGSGRIEPCQIKVLCGEIMNVWPASIFPGLDLPEEATPEQTSAVPATARAPLDVDDLAELLDEMDREWEAERTRR